MRHTIIVALLAVILVAFLFADVEGGRAQSKKHGGKQNSRSYKGKLSKLIKSSAKSSHKSHKPESSQTEARTADLAGKPKVDGNKFEESPASTKNGMKSPKSKKNRKQQSKVTVTESVKRKVTAKNAKQRTKSSRVVKNEKKRFIRSEKIDMEEFDLLDEVNPAETDEKVFTTKVPEPSPIEGDVPNTQGSVLEGGCAGGEAVLEECGAEEFPEVETHNESIGVVEATDKMLRTKEAKDRAEKLMNDIGKMKVHLEGRELRKEQRREGLKKVKDMIDLLIIEDAEEQMLHDLSLISPALSMQFEGCRWRKLSVAKDEARLVEAEQEKIVEIQAEENEPCCKETSEPGPIPVTSRPSEGCTNVQESKQSVQVYTEVKKQVDKLAPTSQCKTLLLEELMTEEHPTVFL